MNVFQASSCQLSYVGLMSTKYLIVFCMFIIYILFIIVYMFNIVYVMFLQNRFEWFDVRFCESTLTRFLVPFGPYFVNMF